jgi:surface antigen
LSRKKRKDVEFEADLKNSKNPDSDVNESGVNGPDKGGSVNNQDQKENTDKESEPNNSEEPKNQENGSPNGSNNISDENNEKQEVSPESRVFDKNPEELSQGNRESRVESSPPPNENVGQDANSVDDKEDTEDSNDKDDSEQNDEEPSNSDSIEDNNDEDKQISDEAEDSKSVTDASEMEDSKVSESNNDQSLQDSKIGGLAGKASDTMDTINKAKKFNDIKNMSKEQASKELYEVGKTVVKKKVMAAVTSAIAPYILPIILAAIAILLTVFIIIGAMISITENKKPAQEGCKVVNENSSDVNIKSGDAEKNAKTIYDYEKKHVKGSTAKGRAAHLGNLYIESARTFDPKTIQGNNSFKESIAKDPSAGGYAFGIAQWDSERRVNLLKYAKKKDKKWNDLGIQLDFMLNHDGSDSEVIKKLLKKDDDIKGITEDIMNDWERAGDKSSIGQRQAAASKYYAKFSKSDDDSSSEDNLEDATDAASDNSDASKNSGCDTGSSGSGKTSGKLGASVDANGESGKVLKQWSSKEEIPEKYKKHIELPEFSNKKLLKSDKNIFPETGNLGECTELTWAYMSQLWKGEQPMNGNGNVIYKAYKSQGAKTTNKPTVGYGFSSNPPYAGATLSSVGHTGVVIGVMEDGKWLMSNYNLNGEGSTKKKRVETFALVDGNKKKDGITFFSGIGGSKIKSKD